MISLKAILWMGAIIILVGVGLVIVLSNHYALEKHIKDLFSDKKDIAIRIMHKLHDSKKWIHKSDFYDFTLDLEQEEMLDGVLSEMHEYNAITAIDDKYHFCSWSNYDKYLDKLRAEENFSKHKAA